MTALSRRAVLAGAAALGLGACGKAAAEARPASARARALIVAARRQLGVTLAYDPVYTRLVYPGGDVDRAKGVCTDVVIRAYRDAFGIDLQRTVHEDMKRAFAAYPKRWGLRRPDSNIDHRRVPNLEMFWSRQSARLPVLRQPSDWQPGDLFTALIDGRLPHTGIVSDRIAANGNPLVIHNIGGGAREEDMLFAHRLTGRFRWRI
ncbi:MULTISPECIES: DUF1287 domain-containing protein [unclassified Novosphingobium]|uniref:DUF1287 domain-containing protein n=1 Tax=unclassified Novosphingobium TaxID=2644732 RepID=UPI0025D6075A|nr:MULTISPECIES: DUF1287 domain-containing protein [unclassified Novosphingobium]HQV03073.1 DUF1287 domain-containing protein [Novosphingobium sp.]